MNNYLKRYYFNKRNNGYSKNDAKRALSLEMRYLCDCNRVIYLCKKYNHPIGSDFYNKGMERTYNYYERWLYALDSKYNSEKG